MGRLDSSKSQIQETAMMQLVKKLKPKRDWLLQKDIYGDVLYLKIHNEVQDKEAEGFGEN